MSTQGAYTPEEDIIITRCIHEAKEKGLSMGDAYKAAHAQMPTRSVLGIGAHWAKTIKPKIESSTRTKKRQTIASFTTEPEAKSAEQFIMVKLKPSQLVSLLHKLLGT